MANPAGESSGEVLRLDFGRRLMLQTNGVDAFAQQRFPEGGIACNPLLYQLLEAPRQCHLLPPFSTPEGNTKVT